MSKHILTLLTLTRLVQTDLQLFTKAPTIPNCDQYTSQLTSLFSLMCNNIANGVDTVLRDSCVGCFQRSSTTNNNQPSLADLNDCAQNYLIDTRYELCSNLLDPVTTIPASGCVTGYCRFVSCIRRVNSDLLIAQCYDAAIELNEALIEEDQVLLVKNVTSCILARSRCSSVNPITGQQQSSKITTTSYGKWGKPQITSVPLYNSLQITPTGDLRIITLPGTTKIQNYFCTPQPNLQESSWLEFSC